MNRCGYGIIILAVTCMTFIEWYALHKGVNGYGLLAFFAGMGGLFGFSLGARITSFQKIIRCFTDDDSNKEKDVTPKSD